MSYFSLQISLTTQAWNRLSRSSEDRFSVLRTPIEKLGGCIHAIYFTTGRFDALAIAEFPEHVTASEIAIACADGGAIASTNTSPLLSFSQAVEARMRDLASDSSTVRSQRYSVAVAGG